MVNRNWIGETKLKKSRVESSAISSISVFESLRLLTPRTTPGLKLLGIRYKLFWTQRNSDRKAFRIPDYQSWLVCGVEKPWYINQKGHFSSCSFLNDCYNNCACKNLTCCWVIYGINQILGSSSASLLDGAGFYEVVILQLFLKSEQTHEHNFTKVRVQWKV